MVMSQDIIKEVIFLFHSFLLGVVITFVYDGFLVLRKMFRHTAFLISLEDIIFWAACAISVFGVLYEENNGMLRWFAVAGAAIGMLIYKKTLSPFIINGTVKISSFILGIFLRILKVLTKPFRILGKKAVKGGESAKRKAGRFGRYMKKKLTEYRKALKIILCKH